jgi:peptidylprolyl isomerase
MKALFLAAAFALATVTGAQAQSNDPENTILMETPHGEVVIELRPDLAPAHAERLRTLTREGFYDGVVFHRVIPGFMAQTGDPTGTGMGGSELPNLQAEFSNERFTRGAVGMARSQNPNSANSQFFIVYGDASWLDGQYTYVGNVVSGMEAVDQIKKGAGQSGMVQDPDSIVSMRMMDAAQ